MSKNYEVGYDFRGDWKGIQSFDSLEEAYVFYLDRLKEDYIKLNCISNSLCIKNSYERTKLFLVESEDWILD